MHRSIAILLLAIIGLGPAAAALSVAITEGKEKKKDSGFQIQKVEVEVLDSLDDFDRYAKRQDWAKAFRVSEDLFAKSSGGMIEDEDGFYVPFYDRLWLRLASIPENGKEAYRLFSDAKARKLFNSLEPGNEREILDTLYRQYFITEVGDEAADRLADLSFEQGEFSRAERIWRQLLEFYPRSGLDRGRIYLKRATALARGGFWRSLEELVAEAGTRHDEPMRMGGREVVLSEVLGELMQLRPDQDAPGEQPAELALEETLDTRWRFPLIDEMTEEAMKRYSRSYYMSVDSMLVPPFVIDQERMYVNWFGNPLALDIKTGKLLWRTGKTHEVVKKQSSNFYRSLGTGIYWIHQTPEHLLAVGYQGKGQSTSKPFSLVALDPKDGKEIWNTYKIEELKTWAIIGEPLVVEDVLYATGSQNNEFQLFAIAHRSGKLLWQLPLGNLEFNQSYYGYVQMRPRPSLGYYQGTLYVLTHYGCLLAVNTSSRQLSWAYSFPRPNIPQNNYYSRSSSQNKALHTYSAPVRVGNRLFLKESFGHRMYALDLDRRELLWERPVNQSDKILAVDEDNMLLLGQEVSAINMEDRSMQWSVKTSNRSGNVNAVVGKDRIFVLGSRGVYELNKRNGDVEKLYRTREDRSLGGRLLHRGNFLFAVSNRSVTAYNVEP